MHIKSMTEFLTEDKRATEFEKYIVIAYNGGFQKAKDTYGVKEENYNEEKEIAENIANDIRRKTKSPSGSMIHFGKGRGKMISWWEGNPTPKTDLYSTAGINISLKQKGGSQLMSGLVGETRSTFKAGQIYMDKYAPKEIDYLIKELEKVLTRITVQGNINTMTKAIKDKVIPDRVDAKTSTGKDKTVMIDKAKYEKEMQTMIDWKSRMKEINPVFIKFFQDNPEFKKWFTYEAATGDMKFKPDNISNATWVVEFDPKTGKNNLIEKLAEGPDSPSAFLEKLSKKVRVRISAKTGTGSKVTAAGTSSTSGAFRVEVREETFQSFMENEWSSFYDRMLLSEEQLDELKIVQSVKNWLSNLYKKILVVIKELAAKGIQALSEFFEFEPTNVQTKGLSLFGY